MPEAVRSQSATTPAPRGLLARLVGILTSPTSTYADVAARPRWLGALLLVLVISGIATGTFLSTEIGRTALLDQQFNSMEAFGRPPTAAQEERLKQFLPYAAYFIVAFQVVTFPMVALVIAAVAFAIFGAVLGGDATFKQLFSVVAHSGFVIAVQQIFVLPLDYARESMSGPTNLAVFLPFLDADTFVARLLGALDLFVIWWMVSLAIGLGVLYKQRTATMTTALLAIYAAIAVVIAAVKTTLSGV